MDNKRTFCTQCGARLSPSQKFCAQCGAAVQTPSESAPPSSQQKPPPISATRWEHNVALITNRFVLFDLVKILGITYILIVILFFILGLLTGEMELGWQMAKVFAVVVPGLALGMLLIMLVFYVNRMPIRYTVDSTGVTSEILGRRSRWANRAGFVLGLLSANPTVAGASLLAKSRETTFYRWRDLHKAAYYPSAQTITLFDSWRSVARLHCTPGQYPEVEALVRNGLMTGALEREKANKKHKGE